MLNLPNYVPIRRTLLRMGSKSIQHTQDSHHTGNSGGSRGESQGAMDPPFQAEPCMQKQDSKQLTRGPTVSPSWYSGFPGQSSYKKSLEHLNLQAQCSSYSTGPRKCSQSAQKWVCPQQSGRGSKIFARFAHNFGTWILPSESSRSTTGQGRFHTARAATIQLQAPLQCF